MAKAAKKATKKPAKKATKKPAKKATKKPTKKATKKPTKKATKKPAKKASKKPAKKATKTPTKKAAKKVANKKVPRDPRKGSPHEPPVFLVLHLPIGISPEVRRDTYEWAIDDALGPLGVVTGGGTALSEGGEIESCDIEVEVYDVARALPILRRVLSGCGAPAGSVVARLAPTGFEVLFEL